MQVRHPKTGAMKVCFSYWQKYSHLIFFYADHKYCIVNLRFFLSHTQLNNWIGVNMNQMHSHGFSRREWEVLLTDKFLPGAVETMTEGSVGYMASESAHDRLWRTQISVHPQSITHTKSHLDRLPKEQRTSVIAHVVVNGLGFIEQDGSQLPFNDGDISFRNLESPSRIVFEQPSVFFALKLSRSVFLNGISFGKSRTFTAHPRITPRTSLCAEAVRHLLFGKASAVEDFCISNALSWLFAAAYHYNGEEIAKEEPRLENGYRWQQILEYIGQHLFEADMMSPSACAKRLGISESYMHRLFAQRGLRFSRYILNQHLDAAYVLLQNKTLRTSNTIASIAYQCGFKEPGHFSRVFKQRFNVSPRDCGSL